MSHEQRLLLAFGLSMLVFLVWFKLFPPPEPVPPTPAPALEPSLEATPPPEQAQGSALPSSQVSSHEEVAQGNEAWENFFEIYSSRISEARRNVRMETEKFRADFAARGAHLESLVLKEYYEDVKEKKPLELVYAGMASLGHLPFAVEIDGHPERTEEANRVFYVSEVERQGEEIRATFLYASEDGFYVRKFFRLREGTYLFDVEIEAAEGGVPLPVYVRLGPGFGAGEEAKANRFYKIREFVFGFTLGSAWDVERALKGDVLKAANRGKEGKLAGFLFWKRLPYVPETEDSVRLVQTPRWVAMGDNYFSVIAFSEQDFQGVRLYAARKEKEIPGKKSFVFEAAGVSVPAGALTQMAFVPKDFDVLRSLGEGLPDLVDLGFFWWLSRPLLWLLNFFHEHVWENYGVAIILVTFIVKILFYPLTHKSMISMRRMQKLQPKISALREKYRKKKDVESRRKMNEEVMGLYKKEGVNPLGGCMPLLLQMPVFFSFYSLLSVSIEIRQAPSAPFFFWVKDLSLPDPYYVTPIVMGITMFFQQRMSQTPTAGSELQMRIMKWMPVIFTWMFLSFPSGLVLYWLTNNVLSIIQQHWINKATAAETAPAPVKEKKRGKKKRKETP